MERVSPRFQISFNELMTTAICLALDNMGKIISYNWGENSRSPGGRPAGIASGIQRRLSIRTGRLLRG
jgi:hypothetical protein